MIKRLLTTVLSLIAALLVHAGNSEYSIRTNRVDLDATSGSNTISVSYPVSPFYVAPDETRNYGKVTLDYNRETHSDMTWDYPWRFSVEIVVFEDGVWQTGDPITLELSWEEGKYYYSDYHIFETDDATLERKIQVTDITASYYNSLTSAWVTASNPTTDSHIPSDIHLELSIRTERYYELDAEETYRIHFDETSNELMWPFVQGAEEYDVEWVFLDVYSKEYIEVMAAIDNATAEALNPGVDFGDNYSGSLPFELKEPTRVNVLGNRYTLDLTYPEGILFYRMRPVGRYVGTSENPVGDYESVKPGAWTYSESDHPSGQITGAIHIAKYEITPTEAFAADQNWLYGVNFAEDGKSVSTLSFYDGAFRGRQALVYNTSDDITLVGESKFDYEGRQSVSIIPAPIEGRNFAYQENFNQNTSHTPFEKEDFDKADPEFLATDITGSTKGASQYFSPNNTFTEDPYRDFIPDAQGYVYSQVKFNKDATGRISETAGVGEDFAIGNGHTVKYLYGNATEFELRRMFGKEVGEADNYKKVLVIDPNGQISVSYLDNHGRVIATGLAGNSPDNLVSLEGTSTPATTALSTNNLVNYPFEQTSRIVISNYATSSEYTFEYDVDGVLYGIENPTNSSEILCIECEYELSFYILRPDGTIQESYFAIITKDGVEDCSSTAGPVNYNPSNGVISFVDLVFDQEGEYEVIKILKVSSNTQANIEEHIESVIGTEQDFIDAALLNVDISGCFTNCDDYCDYVAGVNYTNQTPAPSTPWSELTDLEKQATTFWNTCMDTDCNPAEMFDGDEEDQDDVTNGEDVVLGTISQCDGIRLQMEEQVSPGGLFYDDGSSVFWGLFPGTISSLNLYTDYNSDGSPAAGATIITDPAYLKVAANFQSEWLPTFITFHREYCHYDICLELNSIEDANGVSSMEFDILMSSPQTWTSGTTAAPYLTLAGSAPIHPDPFVGDPNFDPVVSSTTDFITALNNLDHPCISATVNLGGYVDALYNSCSLSLSSDEWSIFYAKYQNLKQIRINAYKDDVATNYAAGCVYYEDDDAIIVNPLIDEDPDEDSDFDTDDIIALEGMLGGPALDFNCEDQCAENIQFWLGNLAPSCLDYLTTNNLDDDLELLLSDYCLTSCYDGNIGGWLYDNGTTEFDNLVTFFDTYTACNLNNILITEGTFTVSTSPVLLENSCLLNVVEAFNAEPDITDGMPSPTVPADCYTLTGTLHNASLDHQLTLASCPTVGCPSCMCTTCSFTTGYVFELYDMDGVPIHLDDVDEITNLVTSQITNTIVYVTVIPDSGPAFEGYLKVDRCYVSTYVYPISYAPPTVDWTTDCINATYMEAYVQAQDEYLSIYNDMLNQLMDEVNCIEDAIEIYSMTYDLKEYQYTLYYYDQAGNLVSTVPPLGVNLLTSTAFDSDGHWDGTTNTNHGYETTYEYNGANLLTTQRTPDGGETNYYYDDLYRLRFSQNAQQLFDNKFSYTKYDELGRMIEAGEAGDPGITAVNFLPEVNNNIYPGSGLRRDYSKIYFEEGITSQPDLIATFTNGQQNLRNRIAAVHQFTGGKYLPTVGGTGVLPVAYGIVHHYTSYSYDEHGNVEEVVQSNSTLGLFDQKHKLIEYDYDLLTGNVKEVVYQRDEMDEWRHKYHYDANNRLVRAWTSDDGEEWEMDAKYFYYLHGSLARVETGHDKVQGTDYAYNMQGWLKGANGTYLDAAKDMGEDGHTSGLDKFSGQDAYGYNLGYYSGDYTNIGATANFANTDYIVTQNGDHGSLYDGNISHMVTAMKDVNEAPINITGNIYKYDQLQRLKYMDVYQVGNTEIYSTPYTTDGFTSATYSPYYHEEYVYDANGNIKNLVRFGNDPTNSVMDYLTYTIDDSNEKNQLLRVQDGMPDAYYDVDVDNQIDVLNYDYNLNGQLTDDLAEGITHIEWTATGKVRRIYKDDDIIEFVYDAMGNRIMKIEGGVDYLGAVYTYYVYDASGNVMATYTRSQRNKVAFPEEELITDKLYLTERMIYGSKRLGVKSEQNRLMAEYSFTPAEIFYDHYYQSFESYSELIIYPENFEKEKRKVDEKFYEFSNHLGNVLEVTTDRKVANSTQDAYEADIVSYSDYYPFGMVMPGRTGSTEDYRYGFQGQEGDPEIKGEGNSVNYKYRMHDPRLGRFFAVDPLAAKYPYNSPYAFSENSVIRFVELEGLEKADPQSGEIWNLNDKYTTASYDGTDLNIQNGTYKVGLFGDELITLHQLESGPNKGNWIGIVHHGGDHYNLFKDPSERVEGYWTEEKYLFTNSAVPTTARFKLDGGTTWGGLLFNDGNLAFAQWANSMGKGYWDCTTGEWVQAEVGVDDIVEGWKSQQSLMGWMFAGTVTTYAVGVGTLPTYQNTGTWQGGGNYGNYGSYGGQQFKFNTSHGYYQVHSPGGSLNGVLTVAQVESSIAQNAYSNIGLIPIGGPVYVGSLNISGVSVGYKAININGTIVVSDYFPK